MKYKFNINFFIVLTIVFVLFSMSLKAQQKPFKFGFKLSPAISWISPDAKNYQGNGSDFTFSWGLMADITLMENYFFATGFNVSYFGGKLKYPHKTLDSENTEYDGEMQRSYNLRYIEVPLALKLKTNELADKLLFFGQIGINAGFNIRAKANDVFRGTHESSGETYSYSEDKLGIKDETSLVKASLLVGAGTEYILDKSVSIVMEINFNNGLTNILKGVNAVDNTIDAKAAPYYFELNLGVIF